MKRSGGWLGVVIAMVKGEVNLYIYLVVCRFYCFLLPLSRELARFLA